jgi:hypothetical protein
MKINIEIRSGRIHSCTTSWSYPDKGLLLEGGPIMEHLSGLGEVSHEGVLEEVKKYLASRGVVKYHVDIWAVVRVGELMTSKHLTYEVY